MLAISNRGNTEERCIICAGHEHGSDKDKTNSGQRYDAMRRKRSNALCGRVGNGPPNCWCRWCRRRLPTRPATSTKPRAPTPADKQAHIQRWRHGHRHRLRSTCARSLNKCIARWARDRKSEQRMATRKLSRSLARCDRELARISLPSHRRSGAQARTRLPPLRTTTLSEDG